MGWDYCCCAIPLLNVGAYFTLSEQFVLGILVGTLAIGTPALVGASVPSFAKVIMLALGYVFAGVQLMGFFGIFKEKPSLFRRYVAINSVVLYAGLSAAAAFIGISAARHSTAVDACEASFFNSGGNQSTTAQEDSEGQQICNIFTWVCLGVMGALWLVLLVVQSYFALVLRNYGVTQRADHTKYHSIYSQGGADQNILLNDRAGRPNTTTAADEWDPRPSTDSWHPNNAKQSHGGYRDDDDNDDAVYEKKYGYGNGGVTTSVQEHGKDGIDEPSYYAPPSQPPPAPSTVAPSYHTDYPAPGHQTNSYGVGQVYGR